MADRSGKNDSAGPSTQPVDEGLEGSVLNDATQGTPGASSRTGAGGEAAVGMHGAGQSGADDIDHSGSRPPENVAEEGDVERSGSEPLGGRTTEHESGYGGKMGEPRTSSDQRQDSDGNGMLEAE